MEIIPAIDVREGACARVLGADATTEGIRSEDTVEQAIIFKNLGVARIHITDLDAAFSGHLNNIDVLRDAVQKTGVSIQYSGGVRKLEHIETLLSLGVERVVLGAAFLRNKRMTAEAFASFGEKIVPGVDSRDGMVAIEGFETSAATQVDNLLDDLWTLGFRRILYTDLRRIGTLKGADCSHIQEMSERGFKVIVAGGINSYECIRNLKNAGAEGAVIGKAIYTGAIELNRAFVSAD